MLKLKIGSEVMLTVNTDIQDCLINVKTRTILHIEGSVYEVCVKYSAAQAGFKAKKSPDLSRKMFCISNEQYKTKISIKK